MCDSLSADQRSLLAILLDELVPPSEDGRFPGAGALGLAAGLEEAAARTPRLRRTLGEALGTLAAWDFAALPRPERVLRLQALAEQAPAGLRTLLVHVYRDYYQHPRVVEALGLEPRPPFPKGFEVAPTDLTLLDPVRRRRKMYLDC